MSIRTDLHHHIFPIDSTIYLIKGNNYKTYQILGKICFNLEIQILESIPLKIAYLNDTWT